MNTKPNLIRNAASRPICGMSTFVPENLDWKFRDRHWGTKRNYSFMNLDSPEVVLKPFSTVLLEGKADAKIQLTSAMQKNKKRKTKKQRKILPYSPTPAPAGSYSRRITSRTLRSTMLLPLTPSRQISHPSLADPAWRRSELQLFCCSYPVRWILGFHTTTLFKLGSKKDNITTTHAQHQKYSTFLFRLIEIYKMRENSYTYH
jgi:hypothetical protein